MLEATTAFFSMFFVDVLHSMYIKYVNEDRLVLSGLVSGLIYFLACVATVNFIDNHWIIIPATIGAGLGTSVGVLVNKKF